MINITICSLYKVSSFFFSVVSVLGAQDESEDDSRTYSITSGEEEDGHVNSDDTDPPLRGEQDGFDGGGDGGGWPSSGKSFDSDIHFAVQETQAILRVMERLGCGATVGRKLCLCIGVRGD